MLSDQLARRPKTGANTLRFLHENHRKECVRGLALNPNLPTNLLLELADSEDAQVCTCVAHNKGTPVSVLRRLAEDSEEGGSSVVARALKT